MIACNICMSGIEPFTLRELPALTFRQFECVYSVHKLGYRNKCMFINEIMQSQLILSFNIFTNSDQMSLVLEACI